MILIYIEIRNFNNFYKCNSFIKYLSSLSILNSINFKKKKISLQLSNKKRSNNFFFHRPSQNSNFQKLTSWQSRREPQPEIRFHPFKNHQSTFRQSQAANTPRPIHAKSHQVEFRSRNKAALPLKARSPLSRVEPRRYHSLKKKEKKTKKG